MYTIFADERVGKLMRQFFLSILLVLGLSGSALCEDFNKGLEAFKEGDHASALYTLTPLANEGNVLSQFLLGIIYKQGRGVEKNLRLAVKWFRLAAEQGNASAQFNLGVMLHDGAGVIQDYREAFKWYKLAAEQGFDHSQLVLSSMYANGEGVKKDLVYAYMWANVSSASGYENARDVRDTIRNLMTNEQIERSQNLARECMNKNYQNC